MKKLAEIFLTNLWEGIGCACAGQTSVISFNSFLFKVLELTSSENRGFEVPTGSINNDIIPMKIFPH